MKKTIYLDNNATTMVDPATAKAAMKFFCQDFGNPSSLHGFGASAQSILQEARETIAGKLGCLPEEIIFTASGTEANNLYLKGYANANRHKGNHIISTKIEHPSVLATLEHLKKNGFAVTLLDVDGKGFVSTDDLTRRIRDNTILISIGHANSEIGTLQDLKSLIKARNGRDIAFHSDCVQSFLKTELDVEGIGLDMASFSGHKFHAPKGAGFIYKRKSITLEPQTHGGGQEFGLRSGTENIPLIHAMAQAVKLHKAEDVSRMRALQSYLLENLLAVDGLIINGPTDLERRICTNINFASSSLEGIYMLKQLSKRGIYVSTGSACSSKHARISPVMEAIGCNPRFIQGNIRVGISKFTTGG